MRFLLVAACLLTVPLSGCIALDAGSTGADDLQSPGGDPAPPGQGGDGPGRWVLPALDGTDAVTGPVNGVLGGDGGSGGGRDGPSSVLFDDDGQGGDGDGDPAGPRDAPDIDAVDRVGGGSADPCTWSLLSLLRGEATAGSLVEHVRHALVCLGLLDPGFLTGR